MISDAASITQSLSDPRSLIGAMEHAIVLNGSVSRALDDSPTFVFYKPMEAINCGHAGVRLRELREWRPDVGGRISFFVFCCRGFTKGEEPTKWLVASYNLS